MNPLGDNLLPYLVLAFGGAMAVGTLLALFRPPEDRRGPDPATKPGAKPGPRPGAPRATKPIEGAPLMRSVLFIAVGALAAVWALVSLVSK